MNPTRPSEVRVLLEQQNLRPLKALGQNFLIDANILNIILDAAQVTAEDHVLEVGPGLGVLTGPLARQARHLTAVEKDHGLYEYLRTTFDADPKVTLIHSDLLDLDLAALLGTGITRVVSNLPYSVGTVILVNLIQAQHRLQGITVTLQQEVAERLVAPPNHPAYGLLSIWGQMDYEIALVKRIKPTCFYPPPRVTSAIIGLTLRPQPLVPLDPRDFFYAVTKRAFGKRRKQLQTILTGEAHSLGLMPGAIPDILNELGLDPKHRPEALGPTEWGLLTNALWRQRSALHPAQKHPGGSSSRKTDPATLI